ncbi:FAD-dependent pyridine nucleotide-disulfide oxidoreductase [Oceanobacillus picturae]|uniref:FAD-dependent pyridine nucleotide-disulfide oxidoreductase n=1 Tax=Oceanobacillus picturae TaxID=171693 RepID=A0A0U9HL23_9BACI|nr:FAD-dependent pyridine nucleotide-disulfide oxidoreductase [Oceanobacillus picturae]
MQYPTINQVKAEIASVEQTDFGFELYDSTGATYQTKKLVLATGVNETFPNIEGFYSFYGKSLFVCPFCDGWEMRDQPLAIVSESPHVFFTLPKWSTIGAKI